MVTDHAYLLEELVPIVEAAGRAIMDIYDTDFATEVKGDGSPVTMADKAAEEIILNGLERIAPDISVVSEEDTASHRSAAPERFLLVDPLDGTKEFLKRDGKGSFTVNIGLVEQGEPTLGVVYAPALGRLFSGSKTLGAKEGNRSIAVRRVPRSGLLAVASLSHRDADTNAWLEDHAIVQTIAIGSSLKFCLLAAGEADVYPRFSPTMEWDTAAADAILRAAGGIVTTPDGLAFRYGKPDHRNTPFIAWGAHGPDD